MVACVVSTDVLTNVWPRRPAASINPIPMKKLPSLPRSLDVRALICVLGITLCRGHIVVFNCSMNACFHQIAPASEADAVSTGVSILASIHSTAFPLFSIEERNRVHVDFEWLWDYKIKWGWMVHAYCISYSVLHLWYTWIDFTLSTVLYDLMQSPITMIIDYTYVFCIEIFFENKV